jgi:hypothetical protein
VFAGRIRKKDWRAKPLPAAPKASLLDEPKTILDLQGVARKDLLIGARHQIANAN